MSVTWPIEIPVSPQPIDVQITRVSINGMTTSVYTGEQQIQAQLGQLWGIEFIYDPMRRDEFEEFSTFLLKLEGIKGTFLAGDPSAKNPRGVASGTPLINGNSQTGTSVNTKGWTPDITDIVKKGDWFQLGSSLTTTLHKILNDASSDATGNATLDIWPKLTNKTMPADNDPIVITNCKGLWRLTSNSAGWGINGALKHRISIEGILAQ